MIAGRVTDPTGGVVVVVSMTATADTGVTIQTRTNAEGHYVLASLVIGQYRVSIEVPGFRRAVSDVIQVHANTRARLDVQLELGAVSDTISVRSLAPLLQTDASSLGRNTLRGPGYFNLDAALTKEMGLGGARRLQLRWEVFNLTNHPSFSLPNTELGSTDFGTIRSTVSTPRQMQFGVKFLF